MYVFFEIINDFCFVTVLCLLERGIAAIDSSFPMMIERTTSATEMRTKTQNNKYANQLDSLRWVTRLREKRAGQDWQEFCPSCHASPTFEWVFSIDSHRFDTLMIDCQSLWYRVLHREATRYWFDSFPTLSSTNRKSCVSCLYIDVLRGHDSLKQQHFH